SIAETVDLADIHCVVAWPRIPGDKSADAVERQTELGRQAGARGAHTVQHGKIQHSFAGRHAACYLEVARLLGPEAAELLVSRCVEAVREGKRCVARRDDVSGEVV